MRGVYFNLDVNFKVHDMIGALVRSLMSLVNTKKDNIKFEKKNTYRGGKERKIAAEIKYTFRATR